MRLDPAEVEKLARLAESRGGKVLGLGIHDAEPTVPALAPGRHELVIPGWRPALKNDLKKVGHWGFARLKKRDRVAVAEAALVRRVPKAIRKRRVSVEVTMAGRMKEVDPDACLWSLLDALVAAGLLVDDSPTWLELGLFTQVRGEAKATRITLEDMEETP